MKFAKNKTKASSGNEQPEKKPGKKRKSAKIAKEQAGPRLKKLGAVGLNQSLVVLVAGVVAVALAHFLAVVPAGEAHYETASAMEADTAQRRLNQSLTALQKQVQAVANQRSVALALAGTIWSGDPGRAIASRTAGFRSSVCIPLPGSAPHR